jgi:hypothetical protein
MFILLNGENVNAFYVSCFCFLIAEGDLKTLIISFCRLRKSRFCFSATETNYGFVRSQGKTGLLFFKGCRFSPHGHDRPGLSRSCFEALRESRKNLVDMG